MLEDYFKSVRLAVCASLSQLLPWLQHLIYPRIQSSNMGCAFLGRSTLDHVSVYQYVTLTLLPQINLPWSGMVFLQAHIYCFAV